MLRFFAGDGVSNVSRRPDIASVIILGRFGQRMTESEYAYEVDVPTRYRDMDPMGWVHNSVLLVYVEEARMGYFNDVLDVPSGEVDGAIARQEIEYASAVESLDEVTVRYRVSELGTSSLTTEFEVESDGQLSASGAVTFVVLDEDREPMTIPDRWRRLIREFEQTPVE
jgi:acyl-CoA thioester hydrolase